MVIPIRVIILGELQAAKTVEGIKRRAGDTRPVQPSMASELARIERRLFATAGQSGAHGRWAPLSPAYAKRKKGPAILMETQALMKSLTGGVNNLSQRQPGSFVYGTSDPKAVFHQRGTPKLKIRRVIDLTQANIASLQKLVRRHIMVKTV